MTGATRDTIDRLLERINAISAPGRDRQASALHIGMVQQASR
ncbi:hypothetical protein [Rhizobium herbae]|uniref:Uncharacterized protein n=1 Tax=Rhizobium herbae TaxID=508661 RepID=A0ABS4EPW9_9HYPH|nr:hypothetical protein [Rhizobium herbae]MBP1859993.1 hypothetical protein [Rhizobium herbae]